MTQRSAAFFDLDMTILAVSSSLAFARPFYRSGLIGPADVLRSAVAQFSFVTSDTTHLQMEQMKRYLSALVTGWDVEQVRQIVDDTYDTIIAPVVFPEAVELIAEHKAAGRDVIIISSSGDDVVDIIGQRLGVDRSVGTKVAIVDGRYTGEITFYAYAQGKADAMQQLADEFGYDLASSFAYSDSHTDLPMLDAVGFPTAVNADSRLREIAIEREWPIRDFTKPAGLQSTRQRITDLTNDLNTPDNRRNALAVGGAVGSAAAAAGIAWLASRRRADAV
ncbi:MAG: HAD family hydrolase [Actinomycetes bacterium]